MARDFEALSCSLACGSVAALRVNGPHTPVLLLHGNSSCKEVFVSVLEILASSRHAAIACDLPGHGQSDDARNPDETYTFPGYADTICEVLDNVGWKRLAVIGWSLGGHIALESMSRDARISDAMLIGTPPGKPSAQAFVEAFHDSPTTRLAGQRYFSEQDARSYACAMYGELEPDPFLLEMARRADGRARERMLQSAFEGCGVDQRELVESSPRMLAIVVGERDPFVRREYLTSLRYRNLWRGKVHVIDGAGHAPHWRPGAPFMTIFTEFLEDIRAQEQASDEAV